MAQQSAHPHVCFDRILPRDLRRLDPAALAAPRNGSAGVARAVLLLRKRWPNGSRLRVSFLEGTASQHAMVAQFAPQWSKHANLQFDFGFARDADIRVAFQRDLGAWSYIGTDCRDIPRDQATMNLGWQDEGVILHEFGHAIGLIHEHQNPRGGIQWTRAAVIRDLSLPPNGWDLDTIEHNMFETYALDQVNGTALDPHSIMMYSFPSEWTLDGFSTPENTVLSAMDISFIGSGAAYAKPSGPASGPATLVVGGPEAKAEIGQPGEEDLFHFTVATPGRYVVETSGNTDVFMTLYGPNSQTALIAQDDDSGPSLNARIVETLRPGDYVVQVRHYNKQGGKGPYGVRVTR
jgi:hypothetical protein